MEFFSEIYGCYYKIVGELLKRADMDTVSKQEIVEITERLGFAESSLTVPEKLCTGQWPLLERLEADKYSSRLDHRPQRPLTLLQRRWLKSLLSDIRIRLFLDDTALAEISQTLSNVEPLWDKEFLYYYDRFEDGDDFSSREYRQSFRLLMDAIRGRKLASFDYTSSKGRHGQRTCLPLKLEYSPKNDRFRLIALRFPFDRRYSITRYRVDNIRNVNLLDTYQDDGSLGSTLDTLLRQGYDTEPVRLLIQNKRNALERAMLHFANYDKDTRQLDENTWECCIYYDSSMETELLIEILSFGPVVQVTGPDSFVELIRERLRMQLGLQTLAPSQNPS